ncbi:shikimate 5-dehydrogenase [Acaricomes phytoseiuli]|uniref:shikimate 5-dehydrogenase n=1 Tax=Acaricomes phytoseiuli TaxID=291968 RepID=UPI00036BDB70|nr:shikimate 5-dehydrogenase [Acaricomes phytoseiuli]MCW1250111.1 shikimate 5-dehydrogenase [Acaricomes phytoseiuli]
MPILNKETQLCISLAARPSNIGTRFHNYLYQELDLNFVYKAFAPTDLADAIRGVRGLPIRGAAVSMPYKEAVIPMVDHLDESAAAIDSVNTVVNDGGLLTAYNTDYLAVARILGEHALPEASAVLLRGSGGMAKAVVAAFRDAGFAQLTVVSRNEETGRALAGRYGFEWVPEQRLVDGEAPPADVLVNVTPLGMAGAEADVLAFPEAAISAAHTVFDVVAFPDRTPLIRRAVADGKQVITGAEVIARQAEEQFVLYTGVRPDPELVKAASEFSRG